MNKTKILVWVIMILVAINVATIISGISYSSKVRRMEDRREEVPLNRRANFFRDQLNLSPEQRDRFMDFNREFNRKARAITDKMNSLRFKMMEEMGKEKPNREKLDDMCLDIGDLHSKLKSATVDYYLDMKSVCDKQQQEMLNLLFERMLSRDRHPDMMGPAKRRHNRGMGPGNKFNINQ